ncbi:MAG: hypothetical protein MI921_05755 [Cytophagales bacterium]|nr:hypothetical protein [Cytophagales bacterium]
MSGHNKYLIFFGILLSGFHLNAQSFITIDSSYLSKTAHFLMAKTGDTICFKTGGIYLVESKQFESMKEIIDFMDSINIEETAQLVIEENERKINEANNLLRNLLKNCNDEHELTKSTLMYTQKSLKDLSFSLENTQNALTLANESVNSSTRLLSGYRSPRIWQSVLIALAGIGVGVVLTQ